MKNFNSKKIVSTQTLGDRLKRTREQTEYSLEEIAGILKIKKEHLIYLEEGKYNKLPSPVFIKNYLKKYSSFLQLNWNTVLKMYDREMIIYRQKKNKNSSSKFNHKPLVIQRLLFIIAIIFLGITLLVYLILEVNNFTEPPQLIINDLPDKIKTKEHNIIIKGMADIDAQVFINGQEVITNQEGVFQEEIYLQSGLNTILISAKKKQGKENIINKQIFVEEESN